jgi:hypothetical protein
MRHDASLGAPGASGASGARLQWPWGVLPLGVLYFLCWAAVEVVTPTTFFGSFLPRPVTLCVQLALLVGLPWLLIMRGVPRDAGVLVQPSVRLAALGATLAGALPTLLCTVVSDSTKLWLIILLPPGFSLGVAVGFVWGVRARARRKKMASTALWLAGLASEFMRVWRKGWDSNPR